MAPKVRPRPDNERVLHTAHQTGNIQTITTHTNKIHNSVYNFVSSIVSRSVNVSVRRQQSVDR